MRNEYDILNKGKENYSLKAKATRKKWSSHLTEIKNQYKYTEKKILKVIISRQ